MAIAYPHPAASQPHLACLAARGSAEPASLPPHYEEDIHPGDHSSVWGSYYDAEARAWGYACCRATTRNACCARSRSIAGHPGGSPRHVGVHCGSEARQARLSDQDTLAEVNDDSHVALADSCARRVADEPAHITTRNEAAVASAEEEGGRIDSTPGGAAGVSGVGCKRPRLTSAAVTDSSAHLRDGGGDPSARLSHPSAGPCGGS